MATVRVSKEIVGNIQSALRRMYEPKIEAKRVMRESVFTHDEAYSLALESVEVTPEALAAVPNSFLYMNTRMYVILYRTAEDKASNRNPIELSFEYKSAKPMGKNWDSSFNSPVKLVHMEGYDARAQWKKDMQDIVDERNTMERKITNFLWECGSINQFVKLYPDGYGLLPSWAKQKLEEKVERKPRAKSEDVIDKETKAAALTNALQEVIAVSVLEGI